MFHGFLHLKADQLTTFLSGHKYVRCGLNSQLALIAYVICKATTAYVTKRLDRYLFGLKVGMVGRW